jgi:hypothetical protein
MGRAKDDRTPGSPRRGSKEITTGPVFDLTPFAVDLARGRWDIEFWAFRFLGIQGHPGQVRFWQTALGRSPNGWMAAWLTFCLSAGNRAGKTLGLAVYILHSTFYKIGTQPPDWSNERSVWTYVKSDYQWFHFGIQQEIADLVFHDIVRIKGGVHESQGTRGCPLVELIGEDVMEVSRKYRGDYPWVVWHPVVGGAEIHFRSTNERALGSLGKDMHGISFDECAFDPALQFIVDEVLHNRRLGTGGQLILVSTATEGMTAFADLWALGDPEAPDRWPGRMSMRMSTRENVGFGLNEEMFTRLIAQMPDYLVPQNIDGFFIESQKAYFGSRSVDACFVDGVEEETPPVAGHRYTHGVDPALTYDSSWSIVLDITDRQRILGVRVRRKTGRQTMLSVSAMVQEGHRAYNTGKTWCATLLDATGFGGKMMKDAVGDIHPLRAVEFGGTKSKKLKLLYDLKGEVESGRLVLPRVGMWLAVRRQLLGYRLDDRALEQDAVMALALAVREAIRQPSSPVEGRFDFFESGVPSTTSRVIDLGRIEVM